MQDNKIPFEPFSDDVVKLVGFKLQGFHVETVVPLTESVRDKLHTLEAITARLEKNSEIANIHNWRDQENHHESLKTLNNKIQKYEQNGLEGGMTDHLQHMKYMLAKIDAYRDSQKKAGKDLSEAEKQYAVHLTRIVEESGKLNTALEKAAEKNMQSGLLERFNNVKKFKEAGGAEALEKAMKDTEALKTRESVFSSVKKAKVLLEDVQTITPELKKEFAKKLDGITSSLNSGNFDVAKTQLEKFLCDELMYRDIIPGGEKTIISPRHRPFLDMAKELNKALPALEKVEEKIDKTTRVQPTGITKNSGVDVSMEDIALPPLPSRLAANPSPDSPRGPSKNKASFLG